MDVLTNSILTRIILHTVFILSCISAHAAERISVFNYWTLWTDMSDGQKICYISSNPVSVEPTNVNRGDIHFIVTVRPENRTDVSTILGYPIHASQPNATVDVDGQQYALITDARAGWLANPGDEPSFVNAMRAGTTMRVRAQSERGTNTVDTYSLIGVTAAMARANTECPPR